MGALTLTNLLPTIYRSLDVVSREMVGFIPAVSRDSSSERAALGDYVVSPVVGAMTAEDITAAAYAADTPAQTISNVQMSITKSRSVPFGITGEESMSLRNAGTLMSVNQDRITQAIRTLANEVETDLAALYTESSRAVGTYNAVPFNSAGVLTDFSSANRVLNDNGAPKTDRHLVLGSSAIANLAGKQSGLYRVNEAGTDELLREGTVSRVQGFGIHDSAQVNEAVTAGTGASATTNTAGYAIGATVVTLASAGTGTLIAGDIITFAGDTNQYVVASGDADVSGGGTITLQEPGLKKALAASAIAITVVAATTRNMFFHRSAIQLATRSPAMPDGGDSAEDMMLITDPVSGITFEFLIYRQKRQLRYEVNLAWGVKVISPRYLGLLIGA